MGNPYPKRLLLAVIGLNPQVLTETLFALHRQAVPMPTEVHILSTLEGAQRACLTLLADRWFAKLCEDYHLPIIQFDEGHIHVLETAEHQPMDDIRTLADNQAAADGIGEWIRRFTEDEHTSLHVSIAGGRKTMGFYAGYALSLFGRQQDQLSHVLVSPPYESHPQFYYPTPNSQIIYTLGQDSKPLDTKDAQVTLADIPFVRLRHGLPKLLLTGKGSFSAAVSIVQESLGPAHLHFELAQRAVYLSGRPLALPPADLAFYSWLARRKISDKTAVKCPSDGAPEFDYADEYLQEYRQISQPEAARNRTEATLVQGMDKHFFEQRKSRINQRLKAELGIHAEAYLIQAIGRRPATRYELGLAAEQIDYF